MRHNFSIEKKDGLVTVQMTERQWRECEKALAAAKLVRTLRRAAKQCETEKDMTPEEVHEYLESLKHD